jgi:hypothetical protein
VVADFLKPARLDDTLAVSVQLESLGKVRCIFAQEIRREDDVLVKAKVTVACVTGESFKPSKSRSPAKEDGSVPMITTHDLTIIAMIMNASVLVKAVMGILLFASMLSWTYIFMKLFAIRRARRQADEFEREFWSGSDLVGLYQRAASGRMQRRPRAHLRSGIQGVSQAEGTPRLGPDFASRGTRRAMKATYQREMDVLESHLNFLATWVP